MNLADVRIYALSLPEVTEKPHFHRTSFRVREKIFVTADAKEPFIHILAGDAVREPALAMHRDWAEKLMWGKKPVGLRVALNNAEAQHVKYLIRQAWKDKAPDSLLRDFDDVER